jgi:hypothetical protein
LAGGLISVTGNVIGGNVLAGGLISVTGNIAGANVNATANVVAGNIISTVFIQGQTIQAAGNLVGGNANIVNNVNAVNGNFTNVAATITTAAQPYITSLGTLANLSVTGNVTVGQLSTIGNLSVGNTLSALVQTKAANAAGIAGEICWDSNYIYVCVATNTWKRAALTGGY